MAALTATTTVALDVAFCCAAPVRRVVAAPAGAVARTSRCQPVARLLAPGTAARCVSRTRVCAAASRRGVTVRAQLAGAAGMGKPRTLFDKIWAEHVVDESDDGTCLLYIDRHLVHEVTSPQAFEGLRTAGRSARRPDCTLATADHNVPTSDRSGFVDVGSFIKEVESRTQVCEGRGGVRGGGGCWKVVALGAVADSSPVASPLASPCAPRSWRWRRT